ncbi:MAG: Fic family protein [Candidatus Methylacidiphilales bacterium]
MSLAHFKKQKKAFATIATIPQTFGINKWNTKKLITLNLIELINKYNSLGINLTIDFEKFNHISLIHHSTKLEGSNLTESETQVLILNGLTPKGKPLQDSLMVTDHEAALKFIINAAQEKKPITIEFIQQINALVVKNTAKIYHTVLGEIDASIGAFRKGNVSAGVSYFPNYDKVVKLVLELVVNINEAMNKDLSLIEKINLSFAAHFNLVGIHSFYDGNGRTSRLLMNYIQAIFHLPFAIVHNESKVEYINALVESRESNNIDLFYSFMTQEYSQLLTSEITKFEALNNKSTTKFNLLF